MKGAGHVILLLLWGIKAIVIGSVPAIHSWTVFHGSIFVNVSSWPKADKQWYLGVRCQRCRLPILFAVDRSGGIGEAQAPTGGKLVLTCSGETCRHRADYTTAAVSRFQKKPVKPSETGTKPVSKSPKRKG